MTRLFSWTSILTVFYLPFGINAQTSTPPLEQVALDFFADSLLNRHDDYKGSVYYFDGKVDETITPLGRSLINKFPDDYKLYRQVKKEERLQDGDRFWKNNKRQSFQIVAKQPIIGNRNGQDSLINNYVKLRVYQRKKVGKKNYVWIGARGALGFHLITYVILLNSGEVISWTNYRLYH